MKIFMMSLAVLIVFCFFDFSPTFGQNASTLADLQEITDMPDDNIAIKDDSAQQKQVKPDSEAEVQWLLGKVVSLDANAASLLVRYSDYDTDMEKDITINVDSDTSYENIKSLDEIKPQDSISVDYVVGSGGKNIARNISLEKIDPGQIVEE